MPGRALARLNESAARFQDHGDRLIELGFIGQSKTGAVDATDRTGSLIVLGGLESRQLIVRRAHPEHGRIILFSLTKEGTNHSFRFWCG
jgi:hypothetical protein